MTPMVDVAFLLLIFFMSTTQFKPHEEVAVKLPASSSEMKVPDTGIIMLTINPAGELFVGDESGDVEEIAKDELMGAIVALRSQRPSARVIVKADKDVEYGHISDVMDVLQETNTSRFNLMTERKPGGARS
jgi:biopolymer transport protein ExbD